MKPTDSRTLVTRQRLLDAAGEVFAEVGFRAATIQAISRRAGANIAAVNYHFGDKEGLYDAVIAWAHERASGVFGADTPEDVPAAERLRAHVEGALRHLLDDGAPAWHGRLMAREMFEPTRALDAFVRDHIRPNHQRLHAIVRELLGDGTSDEEVLRCTSSVIAQCLFYRHSRPVLERLYPGREVGAAEIPALAAHITSFSLAGIAVVAASRLDSRDAVAPRGTTSAPRGKAGRTTKQGAPRTGGRT